MRNLFINFSTPFRGLWSSFAIWHILQMMCFIGFSACIAMAICHYTNDPWRAPGCAEGPRDYGIMRPLCYGACYKKYWFKIGGSGVFPGKGPHAIGSQLRANIHVVRVRDPRASYGFYTYSNVEAGQLCHKGAWGYGVQKKWNSGCATPVVKVVISGKEADLTLLKKNFAPEYAIFRKDVEFRVFGGQEGGRIFTPWARYDIKNNRLILGQLRLESPKLQIRAKGAVIQKGITRLRGPVSLSLGAREKNCSKV